MKIKTFLKLTILLFSLPLMAQTNGEEKFVFPEPLLNLDNYFSHHVLVAEKSTHKLYLFRNTNSYPELVKEYQMVTGKKAGNKLFQGDFRTPEGIYYFNDFLTHQNLLDRHGKQGEIYGVGAFVTDFPNPIDRINKKTGSGIWLHSTNDETRIEKGLDSRGCIVTANVHLIDVAKYVELHRTPVIVVHELRYLTKEVYDNRRNEIMDTVQGWAKSWQQENFNSYISHYHPDFHDPNKGSLKSYSQYKKAVFANPGTPKVEINNVSIMTANNYAVAIFKQDYESSTIKDVGKKTLYLKRDSYYRWKIVAETWTKNGISESQEQLAFRPSMRFFKTQNPNQIFEEAKKGHN